MANTIIDVLNALNLLNWSVLAYGRQRDWVTVSDLSRYASSCLATAVDNEGLSAVVELASAERLLDAEVDRLLSQLSLVQSSQGIPESDSWRLAKLVELQSQDLPWDDKVTRLEEITAEFGFPADMQGCSRYSGGTADPLDELESVILNLKALFGIG